MHSKNGLPDACAFSNKTTVQNMKNIYGSNHDAAHPENGFSHLPPTQTKFIIRFEDNLKVPTHQHSNENEKTYKQSYLDKKFTSYTNKRSVARNLLNMPIEDLNQVTPPIQMGQLLNEYKTHFLNDKSIEENTQKPIRFLNPVQTALIELINRKLYENKRNSSTAKILESEMKITSMVCRELKNVRSISDSLSAFRGNVSATSVFSLKRQLELKKNNKLVKPNIINKNINNKPVHNHKNKDSQQPVSATAIDTETAVTETQSADLNLFQEDHRNAIEQELRPLAEFLDLNALGMPFGSEFAETNEYVDSNNNSNNNSNNTNTNNNSEQLNNEALKTNVNNYTNSNKLTICENVNTENPVSYELTPEKKWQLKEFTTLILNTLIKLSSLGQQKIAQLQKEYDQQIYLKDSEIHKQNTQLDEKRKRIAKFLNCFGTSTAFEFTTKQLNSNSIFLNIYNVMKLNANGSQFFDELNDYKYIIEQYTGYLHKLEAFAQDKSQFFNEFKLFMYELVFEFKLNLVQINTVSREKLESLLTPIRYLIKNDDINPNLKDPRSQKPAQVNFEFDLISNSLYGIDLNFNLENSTASGILFNESRHRKLKYTSMCRKLEPEIISPVINENIINMSSTFINPATPQLRQLDSTISTICPAESDLLDDINPTLFTPESMMRTDYFQIGSPITPRLERDIENNANNQPSTNINDNNPKSEFELSLHPSFSQLNSTGEWSNLNSANEANSKLATENTQSKVAFSMATKVMSKFPSSNSRSSSTEKSSSGMSNYSPNQFQSPDHETKLLSLNQLSSKLTDQESIKRKSSELNYLNLNLKRFRVSRESSQSSSSSSSNSSENSSVEYNRIHRFKKQTNEYRRINDPDTTTQQKRHRERSRTRFNYPTKRRSRSPGNFS